MIKNIIFILIMFLNSAGTLADTDVLTKFIEHSKSVNSKMIEDLPTHSNGRIKPLHSLTRENILFLTGKYANYGLDSIQYYLGLMTFDHSDEVEVINIRSSKIRSQLGLPSGKRFFSLKELRLYPIEAITEPVLRKLQMSGSQILNPDEKDLLEVFHQYELSNSIISAEHLFKVIDFSFVNNTHGQSNTNSPALDSARKYLAALTENNQGNSIQYAIELKNASLNQETPELFKKQIPNLQLEVFYNKARLFLWAALSLLILSVLMLFKSSREKLSKKFFIFTSIVPLLFIAAGFATRIVITGFAPVTNMYGTMIWVSFGVILFSILLFALYNQYNLVGALWFISSILLLLTENIPLILSPDLDPIVAVLRSNLWLTIHVLTITISYAAFTITMILGNNALIRTLLNKLDVSFIKNSAHSVYRMIQLGVFLLTVGIILGGVWADYSWGRFWGWDPKETWALIADLGFIAILHARYVGWVSDFTILMAAPAAYLLVIMAWYGVNFILATGLHSYGFSSGGVMAIGVFVTLQLTLLSAVFVKRRMWIK